MCGGIHEANERLRAFMLARRGRALTDEERVVYQRLLAAWTRAERLNRADVVKAA